MGRLTRDVRRRGRRVMILAAVAAVLQWIPTGAFVLEPGLTAEAVNLVTVQGGGREAAGRFLVVTVAARPANLGLALRKSLDPDATLVPRGAVVPPGESPARFAADTRLQMLESQAMGSYAALRRRGLPAELSGRGFRVLAVRPRSPADGRLAPGDVIVAAAGRPVRHGEDLWQALERLPAGRRLRLTVQRGEARRQVSLAPGEGPRRLGPGGLGVEGVTEGLATRFPVRVDFAVREIGGPSAGLMFTLEILDQLDRSRDLTGGMVVAGTGTIWPSGRVGAVGGIRQKVVAARRAGAAVFLAPADNAEEARAAAGPVRVIPVRTLDEAIRALAPPTRATGVGSIRRSQHASSAQIHVPAARVG